MGRGCFSAGASPASRPSCDGGLPAPPSFSHLAIDFASSGGVGAFFMFQSRLMSRPTRVVGSQSPINA
jgi:hypothetical protein